MRFAIRTAYCITLLVCTVFPVLHADELLDISRDIDFLESAFIPAAETAKTSENYKVVEMRLADFHSRLSRLNQKLHENQVKGYPNFIRYSAELNEIYTHYGLRPRKETRAPRFKHTGMGDYTKVFLRNLRSMHKGKRKDLPRSATLKNINLNAYFAWLDEIGQRNMDIIRNRKNISIRRKRYLEKYVLCIINLRKSTAKLARNPYYNKQDKK